MKYFLSLLLALAILPILTLASFSDVPQNHKFYEEIEFVQQAGFVKGYPSTGSGTEMFFKPEAKINRAEFTKIIIESLYSDEKINNCDTENFSFPDVKNSDWFAKYVCVAKKEKIINGYKNGTFQASNTVTLPEAMKIILEGNEIDLVTEYGEYSGTEWWAKYYDKSSSLFSKKIIALNPYSRCDPGSGECIDINSYEITRGEMAYLIKAVNNELPYFSEIKHPYDHTIYAIKKIGGYNEGCEINGVARCDLVIRKDTKDILVKTLWDSSDKGNPDHIEGVTSIRFLDDGNISLNISRSTPHSSVIEKSEKIYFLVKDLSIYKNEKKNFSIQYPKYWEYNDENNGVYFLTTGFNDSIWGIRISSIDKKEEIIKNTGYQFSDRKEQRESVTLDSGINTTVVTITTASEPDWISKSVYIERGDRLFIIENGAVNDPRFEGFYKSFQFMEK